MPSTNISRFQAQLVPIAYLRLDHVDGCHYDAAHDRWLQDPSTALEPPKLVLYVTAINHLAGPLLFVAIRESWVYNGVSEHLGERFNLKSGESKAFEFTFARLQHGEIAALYLDFIQNNPDWNPNHVMPGVGHGLALRFQSGWDATQKV